MGASGCDEEAFFLEMGRASYGITYEVKCQLSPLIQKDLYKGETFRNLFIWDKKQEAKKKQIMWTNLCWSTKPRNITAVLEVVNLNSIWEW